MGFYAPAQIVRDATEHALGGRGGGHDRTGEAGNCVALMTGWREMVHLIAHRLTDLSSELASIGEPDGTFPVQRGQAMRQGLWEGQICKSLTRRTGDFARKAATWFSNNPAPSMSGICHQSTSTV